MRESATTQCDCVSEWASAKRAADEWRLPLISATPFPSYAIVVKLSSIAIGDGRTDIEGGDPLRQQRRGGGAPPAAQKMRTKRLMCVAVSIAVLRIESMGTLQEGKIDR